MAGSFPSEEAEPSVTGSPQRGTKMTSAVFRFAHKRKIARSRQPGQNGTARRRWVWSAAIEAKWFLPAGDGNPSGFTGFITNAKSNADHIWLPGVRDIPGRRDRGNVAPFRAGFRSTVLHRGTISRQAGPRNIISLIVAVLLRNVVVIRARKVPIFLRNS
jgi:hypothetical protein